MNWWKHSFERLNEEYEMTQKKKQALTNLLNAGRISQSTHESFNKEIDLVVAEIEVQQRALLEKMNKKTEKLEVQIRTLEMLLADFEIQRVSGEIEEEVYQRETNLLSTGLEVARTELNTVREAGDQLSSSMHVPITETLEQQEKQPQDTEGVETAENVETSLQPEIEIVESEETIPVVESEETIPVVESEETIEEELENNLPEPPTEPVETGETDSFENTEETTETWQETSQDTEDTEETTETWQETSQDTEDTEETTENIEGPQPIETVVEAEGIQE